MALTDPGCDWMTHEQLDTDLIPGIGSVSRADKNGDDFGFGQKSSCSPGRDLRVKVVGTFLKVEI